MIVFNTTFHVAEGQQIKFVKYIKSEYIPMAIADGRLSSPRLMRVYGKNEEEGYSYALEFWVENLETLETWNQQIGKKLYLHLLKEFHQQVTGFATILQHIAID